LPNLAAARRARLARARLYLVTDSRTKEGDLSEFLDAVLPAGVDIVQLREKDAEAGDLLRAAVIFRRAADRHDAVFIVNDRPDVALAAGADGVHLGQKDLSARHARRILGDDLVIGLSTHSAEEFESALPDADYVSAGPVYPTPTKPGRKATGLDFVRAAAALCLERAEPRPWFAIGGIDASTIDEVLLAGAERVAVVRAVTEAEDPATAVSGLIERIAEEMAP
jgi:thiamine-phosphate pyrophosphorylase